MTNLARYKKNKSKGSLTVFLDASVILSGLASATGGSGKILLAGGSKKLKLLATPQVISEVAEHLAKLGIETSKLEQLLNRKTISLISDATEKLIRKFTQITRDPDDAHVLAGAATSGAEALISLDKKHIVTKQVQKFLKPMRVVTPKEFWNWLRSNKGKAFSRAT